MATLVEVEKLRLASGEGERQSLVAIQEVCRQRCGKNVEDSYAEKSQKDGDDQTKRISKKKDKRLSLRRKRFCCLINFFLLYICLIVMRILKEMIR